MGSSFRASVDDDAGAQHRNLQRAIAVANFDQPAGASMSQQIVFDLFTNVIEAAPRVGESAFGNQVRAGRERLDLDSCDADAYGGSACFA
jgi:hypothetical protein